MKRENKKLYPNQRVYRVYKTSDDFNQRELDVAVKLLSRIEFYLWLDMMTQRSDITYAFSPQTYHERTGFSISAARLAFNSLITKGFAEMIDSNAVKIYSRNIKDEHQKLYEDNTKTEVDERWI